MFCLAAHTGARRSELIRLRVADVDVVGKTVTIRERKRVKGHVTTRRIPMSAFLIAVLTQWLADHPGGPWLFCHDESVLRSRKRSMTTGHLSQKRRPKSGKERQVGVRQRGITGVTPLTKNEAHDHFKRTLKGSIWNVLRGWHTLRHSFVSACASRGVDQRLVESWSGHMSAEMSRRYAHLYPSTQQEALSSVFDAA
jgi:integrase